MFIEVDTHPFPLPPHTHYNCLMGIEDQYKLFSSHWISVPPMTLPVMSSVAYNCPRLLRQSNLVLSVLGGSRIPRTSWNPPFMSLSTSCPCLPEDLLDIPGSSLHVPLTQLPMLSGFLGHPGILPSCPSHTTAPCCPEDP